MRKYKQWFIGGILIAVGVLMFLNNIGATDISAGTVIRNFWPLALAAWGMTFIAARKSRSDIITGIILVAAGLAVFGNRQEWFNINLSYFWALFWPAVFILAGISFLKGPLTGGKSSLAFMGGLEKTRENWKLENSTWWAVMGGIELDLRKADIEKGRQYSLSFNIMMGGVEIKVPEDVTLYCRGRMILGGMEILEEGTGGIYSSIEAERIAEMKDSAVINISCRVLMGGLEISQP